MKGCFKDKNQINSMIGVRSSPYDLQRVRMEMGRLTSVVLCLPVNGADVALGPFNVFPPRLVCRGVKDLWGKRYMPVAPRVRAFTIVLGTQRGIELQKEL